jgi:hypothetical protein
MCFDILGHAVQAHGGGMLAEEQGWLDGEVEEAARKKTEGTRHLM